MKLAATFLAALLLMPSASLLADVAIPTVSLQPSVIPSPVKSLSAGTVEIRGTVADPGERPVRMRVSTSFGDSFDISVAAQSGRFSCQFPQDFPGARPLAPMLLYVDATDAANFEADGTLEHQAEVLLIVTGDTRGEIPDLPLAFTDDFVDAAGRKDAESAQWPVYRPLVNLYLRSRGPRLAGFGRVDFDLARPVDWDWFKNTGTLYDFAHRDRDWSQPLGHRVAAGFWQAVWNTWFNASNDHPWDGNPANRDPRNFRPYTFTNDLADILVLYQMRRGLPRAVADRRDELSREALANLLALQHRSSKNFALREKSGRQERYTAGAFHYGMFTTGEWLTEGTGWFANPEFGDHRQGGVFNGRAVWGLGESLKAEPDGKLAPQTRQAIALALQFCLHDAVQQGYAREVKPGLVFWRDAGEHGYLLLGMLAACEVAPDLPVSLANGKSPRTLRDACGDALDACVAAVQPSGVWTPYPDQDAMAIAALATGARVLPQHPHREAWLKVARFAADDWMAAKADSAERALPTPHFGFRKGRGMTHFMGDDHRVRFTFYVDGHWLHALAKLHNATGDACYRHRCHELLSYLCGANPFHARLFNELGAVYNFVTDNDGNGIEDRLQHDLYPESTAFVQIGLLHLLSP